MHIYLRGNKQQRLRLMSGLVLFAFAAAHFLNHAVGLIGLEAMHIVQAWRTAVTRSWPGSIVLLAALLTHVMLALTKLARRDSLRMPRWEALQIASGLAIPFLLLPHIVNTRVAHLFFGVDDTYLYELARLWPDSALLQSLLLLLVWTHGCFGIHYWLRLSDTYRRYVAGLFMLAIAVPVLAIAGFAVSGWVTADIMSDPAALAALKARSHWPNSLDSETLAYLRTRARIGFAALLAVMIGVLLVRRGRRIGRRGGLIITYLGGPTVALRRGMTLLEGSRSARVSHASICGGRGRCSTCRVRIEDGLGSLPPPAGAEAITLKSIDAPPNVRLACQIRPTRALSVAIISHPDTPGPPQAGFIEVREVVAAHVRATLGEQLMDLASSDPETVQRWVHAKIGYLITIADLTADGFILRGARLDYLLNQPVAALVYIRQSRAITLFVLPDDSAGTLIIRGQRDGYHVHAWTDAGRALFSVSDLPPNVLDRMEQCLSTVRVP
jgi:adenylate cyclase